MTADPTIEPDDIDPDDAWPDPYDVMRENELWESYE